MTRRNRKREWSIVIGVAILFHAVLFISIRPEFFSAFRKTVSNDASRRFEADAIVTIPIEIEDQLEDSAEQDPVQDAKEPAREPRKERLDQPRNESASSDGSPDTEAIEIESLTGRSPETLRRNQGPQGLAIPPRPVELTWPNTRNLGHCLGHSIDVRIEVGRRGEVLDVQAAGNDHPSDCIRAAIASARRIVFEPGEIDGVPSQMWTQIRIEFRKKN